MKIASDNNSILVLASSHYNSDLVSFLRLSLEGEILLEVEADSHAIQIFPL